MNVIQELKDDNQKALKALFDRYAEEVYRLAIRFLKDQFESEDVVQEVFLKLWNARKTLDVNGNIWSLLYVITKRLAFNKLREKLNGPVRDFLMEELDVVASSTADDYTVSNEIATLEKQIINRLPQQQKQVYLLSREEGLSYKEIGEKLNISPNTVKNHIVQSLKYFKSSFRKYGYQFLLFFLFIH